MTNDEFQKAVLNELKSINSRIGNIEESQDSMAGRQSNMEVQLSNMEVQLSSMETQLSSMETRQNNMEIRQNNMEIRQDEIYQIVRAIEHSNNVGRSELDSHNIRIAKMEGTFKKVAKAYNEIVDVDKASNL